MPTRKPAPQPEPEPQPESKPERQPRTLRSVISDEHTPITITVSDLAMHTKEVLTLLHATGSKMCLVTQRGVVVARLYTSVREGDTAGDAA